MQHRELVGIVVVLTAGCFAPPSDGATGPASSPIINGSWAEYSSQFGTLRFEVAGMTNIPVGDGVLAPAFMIALTTDRKEFSTDAFFVAADSGKLIAVRDQLQDGANQLRYMHKDVHSFRTSLPLVLFQAARSGFPLEVAGQMISEPRGPSLQGTVELTKIALPSRQSSGGQLPWSVDIDDSLFPLRVEGTTWGALDRTRLGPGTGKPIGILSKANPEPLPGHEWSALALPERNPSTFFFPLREALSFIEGTEAYQAYKSRNPEHRIHQASNREVRPVIPPYSNSWSVELVSPDGHAFNCEIEMRFLPSGQKMEPTVQRADEKDVAAVVPRELLPLRLAYADEVWQKGFVPPASAFSTKDTIGIFEFNTWESEYTFIADDTHLENHGRLSVIAPNWIAEYRMFDGALLRLSSTESWNP